MMAARECEKQWANRFSLSMVLVATIIVGLSCQGVKANIAAGGATCKFDDEICDSACKYERSYVCADGFLPRLDVTNHIGNLRIFNVTARRAELLATYATRQEDLRVFDVRDSRILQSNFSKTSSDKGRASLQFSNPTSFNLERIALSNLSCLPFQSSTCELTIMVSSLVNLRSLSLTNVSMVSESDSDNNTQVDGEVADGLVLRSLPLLNVLTVERSGIRWFDTSRLDAATRSAPVSFLRLASNRLESVALIGDWLRSLRLLDLSYNRLPAGSLVRLFSEITLNRTLPELRQLDLRDNLLADNDVEAVTAVANKLETFDVSSNRLVGEFSVPHCDLLVSLNLSRNDLTQLPVLGNTRRGCESLQVLDLSHNRLRQLDRLYCRPPSIKRSPGSDFPEEDEVMNCSFPVLRLLNVSFNFIESLAASFVRSIGSESFWELDLRGNRLAVFSPDLLLVGARVGGGAESLPYYYEERSELRHSGSNGCGVRRVLLAGNLQLDLLGRVDYLDCEAVIRTIVTSTTESISATTSTSTLLIDTTSSTMETTTQTSTTSSEPVTNSTSRLTSLESTSDALERSTSTTGMSSSVRHVTEVKGLLEVQSPALPTSHVSATDVQFSVTHRSTTGKLGTSEFAQENATDRGAFRAFAESNAEMIVVLCGILLAMMLVLVSVAVALAVRLRRRTSKFRRLLKNRRDAPIDWMDRSSSHKYSSVEGCLSTCDRHLIVSVDPNADGAAIIDANESETDDRKRVRSRNEFANGTDVETDTESEKRKGEQFQLFDTINNGNRDGRKPKRPDNEYTTRNKLLAQSNWSVKSILLGLPPDKPTGRSESDDRLDFLAFKANARPETDL